MVQTGSAVVPPWRNFWLINPLLSLRSILLSYHQSDAEARVRFQRLVAFVVLLLGGLPALLPGGLDVSAAGQRDAKAVTVYVTKTGR